MYTFSGLKGSKCYVTVQINWKRPKTSFKPQNDDKQTSEFGGGEYRKSSTLSTFTTESPHEYFLWVKTKLTGSKGHIPVQIDQK